MTLQQTIIFTALPRRVDTTKRELHLSVFVSPRLWADTAMSAALTLTDYPAWQDWPTTLASLKLQVMFEGGPTLDVTPDSTARSDVWQTIFTPTTPVIPFEFDNRVAATVEGLGMPDLHVVLQTMYTNVATSPAYGTGADKPPIAVLGRDPIMVAAASPLVPNPIIDEPAANRPPAVLKPVHGKGKPGRGQQPIDEDGSTGCLAGCLAIFALIVGWLLGRAVRPLFRVRKVRGAPLPVQPLPQPLPIPVQPVLPLLAPVTTLPTTEAAKRAASAIPTLKAHLQPYQPNLPDEITFLNEYDFHQMVSSAGDQPTLMRLLGLVIDLVVPLDTAVPLPASTVQIAITVPAGMSMPVATHFFSPRTHYSLAFNTDGSVRTFITAARPGSDIVDGVMNLSNQDRFEIIGEEVVGGTLKLEGAATKIVSIANNVMDIPSDVSGADTGSVPALRSAGLSLLDRRTVFQFQTAFQSSAVLNGFLASQGMTPVSSPAPDQPPSDEVYAEDVVRGYRVDVWDDKSAAWHSLHQRTTTHTLPQNPVVTINSYSEEGFVQLAANVKPSTPQINVVEALFTWDGWSLSAPRPGYTLVKDITNTDPSKRKYDVVGNASPDNPLFGLTTTHKVQPGSLPRLRFGTTYQLRVRVVDLAGNSVTAPGAIDYAPEPDALYLSPKFTYRRFEPLDPPALVLHKATLPPIPAISDVVIEGESAERLVVRSATEDTLTEIANQRSERILVAPKTSQKMAEHHGQFDNMNPTDAYARAAREAGSVTMRVDETSGKAISIDSVRTVPNDSGDPSQPPTQHTLTVHTGNSYDLRYLPDPLAYGVLIVARWKQPSADEIVFEQPLAFTGPYPDLQPIRITLVASRDSHVPPYHIGMSGNPLTGGALTVTLQPAQVLTLRFCTVMQPADLPLMGVWGWITDANPPNLAGITNLTEAGRNWLLMPYRELTLVHAVREPLAPPTVDEIVPTERALGDTLLQIGGVMGVDGKSTGKADLYATWPDFYDPGIGAVQTLVNRIQVDEVRLGTELENTDDEYLMFSFTHDIGDTHYHSATYSAIASSRFREYFPVDLLPSRFIRPTEQERIELMSASQQAALIKTVDILNTARPTAPVVKDVMPAFHWDQHPQLGAAPNLSYSSERTGNILRVYLDRPWFSSGNGELLGVVFLPDARFTDIRADMLKRVTFWGLDPTFDAPPPSTSAMLSNFVGYMTPNPTVTLEENGSPVTVVGYPVTLDMDRNMWYADVQLNLAGAAYFPFVRLAVCRYQPNSITGAHISRVVQTDYAQLVPTRHATFEVQPQTNGQQTVHVRIAGTPYRQSSAGSYDPNTTWKVRGETINQNDQSGDGWQWAISGVLTSTSDGLLWEGDVTFPGAFVSGQARVILQEVEQLDQQLDGLNADDRVPRVIYADIFPRTDKDNDWYAEYIIPIKQ